MTIDEIRSKYLAFFAQQGHAVVPSSPLVPENDPTTLFTGSGMQPMVPYLLGEMHPKGSRIVDSQKCFRTQDIEEVGDNRHTTFFEMLGNWSLGDYFKNEQLRWVFTFLTQEVGLSPERLYVSVFRGNDEIGVKKDNESISVWQMLFEEVGITARVADDAETLGMQGAKIFLYDEKKNWWSRAGVPQNMPVGEPGGPDSEVFFDFGEDRGLHEQSQWKDRECHINCDCGRFLEIGNSVFMEFIKNENGGFDQLKNKNVDFGGGLERLGAASLDDPDVFKTSVFLPIIRKLEERVSSSYEDKQFQQSFRVVADHVRAAVFLIADGVRPSNKEQGYFLRRVIRRALRHMRLMGSSQFFLSELANVVGEIFDQAYPEILSQIDQISKVLSEEEQKFSETLDRGLAEIEKIKIIDGATAFMLYETYGFPFELTQEIAMDRGQKIDEAAFFDAKLAHAKKSRTASAGMFKGGLQDASETTTQYHTATHLLHAALRKIIGTHVQQKGSHITAERARFDFSHPRALTNEELLAVETQINAWIHDGHDVTMEKMDKQVALSKGALAFFADKYPDEVSVYTIGYQKDGTWVSKELCGGPHVTNTKLIPPIQLYKEQASSSGVRRLYMRSR